MICVCKHREEEGGDEEKNTLKKTEKHPVKLGKKGKTPLRALLLRRSYYTNGKISVIRAGRQAGTRLGRHYYCPGPKVSTMHTHIHWKEVASELHLNLLLNHDNKVHRHRRPKKVLVKCHAIQ